MHLVYQDWVHKGELITHTFSTLKWEQNNENQKLTIYGTSHASVFPFLLSKNVTTFASGYTQTSFFCFYPTHLLQQKQSIAGLKFKKLHSDSERTLYEALLKKKGYVLRYSHIGSDDDLSIGCTMFHHRVDDLTGTTLFCWGVGDTDYTDPIQNSLLDTQYTWVNGADYHAPCCIPI